MPDHIEELEFVWPHPLVTLLCVGGLGYALPAIAWRPDLLPPPDFALGLGEFMLLLAEDYRQGDRRDFDVYVPRLRGPASWQRGEFTQPRAYFFALCCVPSCAFLLSNMLRESRPSSASGRCYDFRATSII